MLPEFYCPEIVISLEMPQEHSYSMANQVVQPYFLIEQDAWRVEEKYIGTDLQE